jgi:hypothetical protein
VGRRQPSRVLAINIPSVVIEIRPGVTLIRVKQYPILVRAQEGISHHLQKLSNHGILRPGIPPYYQSRSQAPMITTQCMISEQSIKQQQLCTWWF